MRRVIGVPIAVMTILAPALPLASSQASPFRAGQDAGPEHDNGPVILIDAHAYRHCHYIHTRVYCHKSEPLPMNWPPNTDTPHGSTYENPRGPPPSLRKRLAS